MDKYEFNIKLEQIKKLAAKKEYKQAAEIAKQMNCSVQHVYNQRSLALKRLRQLLREEGADV